MRLRKVKGAFEKVLNSKYVISKPSLYKGQYNKLFKNNNPIHLEIGMGKGKFIIEKAISNPNINYIGIERFDSVLVRAVEKVEERIIPNLLFIKGDAIKINEFFAQEIQTIYLNFSDPWPKNRHEHRRLSSDRFLNRYDKVFKTSNHIIMKSDNRKLIEFSLKSFVNHGYKIKEISLDLHHDNFSDNIMTEYEEKFNAKGANIYMLNVIKDRHLIDE